MKEMQLLFDYPPSSDACDDGGTSNHGSLSMLRRCPDEPVKAMRRILDVTRLTEGIAEATAQIAENGRATQNHHRRSRSWKFQNRQKFGNESGLCSVSETIKAYLLPTQSGNQSIESQTYRPSLDGLTLQRSVFYHHLTPHHTSSKWLPQNRRSLSPRSMPTRLL